MPTKCTRPSWSAREQLVGDRDPHRPPPPPPRPRSAASLLVGVARDQRRRRRRPSRPAARGRWRGRARCAATHSGVSAASSTSSAAAGVDDRAGVERLLAVADRQRHEDRRQPDGGGLGDGVGARPGRPQVGGGVGEVHPVDERHARRTADRRARRRRRPRPSGPTTCSTWTPASAERAARRAETDWLSRRAPCEPPVTSSVGRSGSSPKDARASARSAARSSVEIIRRIGRPTYVGVRQRRVREADRDAGGEPGAEPCWRCPGSALPSCTTSGSLRRRAAR